MNKLIDNYIAGFPEEVAGRLEKIRQLIREIIPEAEESIKYGMPTFVLNGNLVHYAAYKNHIGFYPSPSGLLAFRDEVSKYKNSKGAVQFPHDGPVPYDLIEKIVRFRVQENLSGNKK